MSIMYCKPPTNPDGSKATYQQRRAANRAADAERRAQQKKEPADRAAVFDLPYRQRREVRRAEELGKVEARQLAKIEESTAKEAAITATPPHLRRPDNIYHRLVAEWQSKSYRPDVARKIEEYQRQAAEREKEIDAEMAEKLRRYETDSNPEVQRARAHYESGSAGAETPEEQAEWARLSGLLSAGQTGAYWDSAAQLMQARLQHIREQVAMGQARQAPLIEEARLLGERQMVAEQLQVKSEDQAAPVESGDAQTIGENQ